MTKLEEEILNEINIIKKKAQNNTEHSTHEFEVLFLASLLEEETSNDISKRL